MRSNLDYFSIATKHKEKMLDKNYHKIVDNRVIPLTIKEENLLTKSNNNVIRFIDTIHTMIHDMKYTINHDEIIKIILLIIKELNTKGMNYSAFCQYFNVHNINYSIFQTLKLEEKIEVIKFIITYYISSRHQMYKSHGYSNIVLQVMSDNYSHKRKGTYGSNKIADTLKLNGLTDLTKMKSKDFNQDFYYLLSDKSGKTLFKKFSELCGIKLSEEGRETQKYPDALVKIGEDFFIIEQKNMKENGGGQDKQASEITDFINRVPELSSLHYVTYVDGIYFNQLDNNATAKTLQQYNDIISVLSKFKTNYFVNSFAFNILISDFIHNCSCKKVSGHINILRQNLKLITKK